MLYDGTLGGDAHGMMVDEERRRSAEACHAAALEAGNSDEPSKLGKIAFLLGCIVFLFVWLY